MKTPQKTKSGLSIRRFSRLLEGAQAAALTKLLWQTPKFSVKVSKNGQSIKFTFGVPVPRKFRTSYPPAWELLFGAGSGHLEKALNDAYWNAKSGNRTVHTYISSFLRRVYKDALDFYLQDAWNRPKTQLRKELELEAFRKHAKIKRFQPDPWLALLIAQRFEKLRSDIEKFRIDIRKMGHMNNATLAKEIQERIPAGTPTCTPQRVLSELSSAKGDNALQILFAQIAVDQIAEAFISCEMNERGFELGKPSLRSYVRYGKQIRDSLATIHARDAMSSHLVPTPL